LVSVDDGQTPPRIVSNTSVRVFYTAWRLTKLRLAAVLYGNNCGGNVIRIWRAKVVVVGMASYAILLMCYAPGQSAAQQKAIPGAEIYALMEVVWDMPSGFEAAPQNGKIPGETSGSGESNHAYGTKEMPSPEHFSKPIRKASADVRIWITPSQELALQTILPGNAKYHFNMQAADGSCSGKPIGDVCAHAIIGAPHPIGAALWFVKDNIAFYMDLRGPARDHDWPKEIERLAAKLLLREAAAKTLAAARGETLQVHGRSITARNIGGVKLVHVSDYADAAGVKISLDIVKSIVEIKSAHHDLELHIGTKAGTLDGKPISLAFPALRDGPANVYCPIDTLKTIDR
jgi:hypothetical protein